MFIEKYADKLLPFKPFILLIILLSFISVITIVVTSDSHQEDVFLIPSILLLIWSLVFFNLINLFANAPRKPTKNDAFFLKIKIRLKRAWYHFLSLIFILISITAIFFTMKLLGVWFLRY